MQVESAIERHDRFTSAKAKAAAYRGRLAEIYAYVFPKRNCFNKKASDQALVYDMTAVIAAQDFANNFLTMMMPPYRNWANLGCGLMLSDELESAGKSSEDSDIKEELQKIEKTLFQCIHASNFSLAIHEALLDFCAGTGVILINESDNDSVINVHSVPISDVYFEEGAFGDLENFWREQKLTARQILRSWPKADLTSDMRQNFEQSKSDKEFDLIEGVVYYPDKKGEDNQLPYYYYVEDLASQKEIFYEWKDYCPFIGFRYSRNAGDIIGHGVAEFALSFIVVLNRLAELDLKSQQFKAFPALVYDPRKLHINEYTLRIEPGCLIPASSLEKGLPIAPIPAMSGSRDAQLFIPDLQRIIRSAFLLHGIDDIMYSPKMTATEIAVRQQEFMRRIGGSVGRFAQEFIKPFLTAVLKILKRRGKFTELSVFGGDIGFKVNDQFIRIEYNSPVFKLEKRENISNTTEWAMLLGQMFGQNALLNINQDEVARYLADKLDVDQSLIRESSSEANLDQLLAKYVESEQVPNASLGPKVIPLEQQEILRIPDEPRFG